MSLNKINRVRVIRYLYDVESGGMDKYTKIYDWYRDLNNYFGTRYRVNTENHSVIISSPVTRSHIFQKVGYFEQVQMPNFSVEVDK